MTSCANLYLPSSKLILKMRVMGKMRLHKNMMMSLCGQRRQWLVVNLSPSRICRYLPCSYSQIFCKSSICLCKCAPKSSYSWVMLCLPLSLPFSAVSSIFSPPVSSWSYQKVVFETKLTLAIVIFLRLDAWVVALLSSASWSRSSTCRSLHFLS